ncbi:MAG TPA: S41 family peptidase [Pyrinomonadaceae bacterium]|nr:S41 family peptidase [Pyrinomonadaceae bacterium]
MPRPATTKAFALACCLALLRLSAHGQQPSLTANAQEVAGRYEGVAHSRTSGDIPVTAEIRVATGGAVTGVMQTPLGDLSITNVSYAGGTLKFRIESYDDDGTVTARFADGKITGEFEGFGQSGTIELRRTGPAGPVPDTRPVLNLGPEAWREDLRFLARELPRKHKNAFHLTTRAEFERAVAELDARIPSLSDSERVVHLSRIVAMIGDGHTALGWRWLYPRVPLELFWFGSELRVTRAAKTHRRALGAKLVKVGGAPIADVYARSLPFIPRGESEGFVRSTHADLVTHPVFLHALGLAPDNARARYTFEDERGRTFTLDLGAEAASRPAEWLDAAARTPLYREQPDAPLWFEHLPDARTLYVNFKGYPRRREFAEVSKKLFDFLDRNPVERVVFDLRQNGGGDLTRGRDFVIKQVKERPSVNRRGRLYVVIGRWTYSAGMANAADFRNDTNAILVGEPTGARPNGYQEGRGFMLPNSRLPVNYSIEFYKFQEKDTPGIIPDKRIDPDWPSYKRGRDPVMEWILNQKVSSKQ